MAIADHRLPSPREAYWPFLRTADLTSWRQCLREYDHLTAPSEKSETTSLAELTEALCISIYVQWLSRLCGENEIHQQTVKNFKRLVALAAGVNWRVPSKDAVLVKAIIAAGSGYARTGEQILGNGYDDIPLEIALLVLPESPSKRAQLLKKYIARDPKETFLPAFYFYAHGLLDLGYCQ